MMKNNINIGQKWSHKLTHKVVEILAVYPDHVLVQSCGYYKSGPQKIKKSTLKWYVRVS